MNLRKPVLPDAKRPNASYLAHAKVLSMFSKVSWRCFSWPLCDFLSLARWSWGGRVRAALLAQGREEHGHVCEFRRVLLGLEKILQQTAHSFQFFSRCTGHAPNPE